MMGFKQSCSESNDVCCVLLKTLWESRNVLWQERVKFVNQDQVVFVGWEFQIRMVCDLNISSIDELAELFLISFE